MNKPFSQACENNRQPILDVLSRWLGTACSSVLEVGSGTGQHAVFMGEHLSHVQWQTSDLPENHRGILAWLEDAQSRNQCKNVLSPLNLDVATGWPNRTYDAIFSANTLHIMSWQHVEQFFPGAAKALEQGGLLCVYGPFNYNGQFTSDSNRQFNQWLGQQNPVSGIRDFEKVNALAASQGLDLQEDNAMPANNRLLIWQKR